ncbi:OmpA family protein, partial [bacterium]|nr:OmpA family protein [bacterium]
MKKYLSLFIAAILLLPACGWSSKSKSSRKAKQKTEMQTAQVDIPVVSDEITSYFDEDVNEFELESVQAEMPDFEAIDESEIEQAALDSLDDDFFWIEESDEKKDSFKNVYFDFDKEDVEKDQEEYISHNVEVAQKLIEEGENPTITIEGHACSSAGSRAYNLAISNNRA